MGNKSPEILKKVDEAKELYKFKAGMTTEEKTDIFIKRSCHIYGNKYDYSKAKVNMIHDKVTIICNVHGEFSQTPHSHMLGNQCFKCLGCPAYTKEEWIAKATEIHKNKYDYSKVKYINSDTKITIHCIEHGDFEQLPRGHIRTNGRGCPKCAKCHNYTTEEWINMAKNVHDNYYDYSKTNYVNGKTPVIILCPDHKEFIQSPRCHMSGTGCPLCINKTQTRLFEWLKKIFPNTKREALFEWSKSPLTNRYLRFDFYIEELNCIIELDGRQHFIQVMEWQTPDFSQQRDVWKMQQANKNNISVIRIYQLDVFYNKDKWLDTNLFPKLIKRKNPENHYITIAKRATLYDKHKGLIKKQIILDKNINLEDNSEDEIINDKDLELMQ
jgi:very-short-patch-repair endonuclease